ncbi:MAG: hypothetical protein RL095_2385 [Verrucomicrobiota bacterium]|jgi:radical SAM superfamily enzyme YgiQ (UPF0313 family)
MRILFAAMSGVRCQDAELLARGLTLPGFVERSQVIASLPSLGLLTLAGMTDPERHQRLYHEVPDRAAFARLPLEVDLVVISSFSAQIFEAYELAALYRSRGVPVVMGGLHVTSLPDEALAHCDAVSIGEGEVTWPELLADAEAGKLARIYDARGREFDLAQSPMPAFELLDRRKYNRLTVQTSRGCPHRCSFCAGSILLTPRYKQKPMERVLAEIDRIRQLWPRPFIEFADDNSFINRPYWQALLPELAKRELRWFTETDLSVADDPELLKAIAKAGCRELLIGLESPVSAGLDGLEMRANWKLKRQHSALAAVKRIQDHGIRVNGCFIVGLDEHDPSIFAAVAEFAQEAGLYDVQVTLPTPFPGTPFLEKLRREGRLLADGAWDRCTLFDLLFTPQRMSAEQLTTGFRELVERLYSAEATERRRAVFHLQLRRWRRRIATPLQEWT